MGRAKYRTVALTVAKEFTEPNPQQLEAIHKEETLKKDIFQQTSPEREWSGRFLAPVQAPVSDQFGTQRKFNGKIQSVHQGLDYHVSQGTPVSAVNAGTVILARPLFFEGNCVVLDHGQGLMTLYLHLSEFKVKEGDSCETRSDTGSERRYGPRHGRTSTRCRTMARGISESRHALLYSLSGKLTGTHRPRLFNARKLYCFSGGGRSESLRSRLRISRCR